MALDVVHAFLQSVGKGLDEFRIGIYKAFFGTECGVRDIAGIFAQGGYDMTVAFCFQCGGVRFEFHCEPYITLEQLQLARRTSQSKTRTGDYAPYIFSSLIKCPWCGNNFTGYRKKQKLKGGGESIYVKYRCGNKFGRHSGAHLTEHIVEEYMVSHVQEQLEEEIAKMKASMGRKPRKAPSASIQAEIDRLNIQFQKGRISEEYYDSQYEALSEKLRQIKEEAAPVNLAAYKRLEDAFSGNWKEIYENLDNAHKNAFWKSIISRIEIDPETHKIKGFKFI